MSSSFNIGISFRTLANIEQAFVHHLNFTRNKELEFHKIRTINFPLEYRLSEDDYHFELNSFLEKQMHHVSPVNGAPGPVLSLLRYFPNMCVITDLDAMHQERFVAWIKKHFDGWEPELLHACSMSGTNREEHWFEKDDICYIKLLNVFVAHNPIDTVRVSELMPLEIEVLRLEMPWNINFHHGEVDELGSWEEILTEIHIRAKA